MRILTHCPQSARVGREQQYRAPQHFGAPREIDPEPEPLRRARTRNFLDLRENVVQRSAQDIETLAIIG